MYQKKIAIFPQNLYRMHVYIRYHKDALESKRMKSIYLKQIKKLKNVLFASSYLYFAFSHNIKSY